MIINTRAYARAGLVGNPSDGYFGKTISIIVKNYSAEAVLYETPRLTIVPAQQDMMEYASMEALASDIVTYGHYGGARLVKAAIHRFQRYCIDNSIELDSRNFTVEYKTNIPQRVGLAGSSAIIMAVLRALMQFYDVTIDKPLLANLTLSVETEELGLPAGLQDRVVQAYEGCVYMDFNRELMETRGYGEYEPIDPALLPPLFVASQANLSEGTEVFHSNIRARWEDGDEKVHQAMWDFEECASEVRQLLLDGKGEEIGPVLNRNFERRAAIYNIRESNLQVVQEARKAGASAKFAGSGGAFIGTYPDEAAFDRVKTALEKLGAVVIRPKIA